MNDVFDIKLLKSKFFIEKTLSNLQRSLSNQRSDSVLGTYVKTRVDSVRLIISVLFDLT